MPLGPGPRTPVPWCPGTRDPILAMSVVLDLVIKTIMYIQCCQSRSRQYVYQEYNVTSLDQVTPVSQDHS